MITKFMKLVSAAVLVLAVFWRSSANFQLAMALLICVAGLLVIAQAVRARKYTWAAVFLVITVLFNPIVPVTLPGRLYVLTNLSCLAAFLASLGTLKSRPILSVPSIVGRSVGRESL